MLDDVIEIIEEEPYACLGTILILIFIAAGFSYMFDSYYSKQAIAAPAIVNNTTYEPVYTITPQPVIMPEYNVLPVAYDGVPFGFKRDINRDPEGVYYTYIADDCEVAFIDIEVWSAWYPKNLKVVSGDLPGLPMYTRFGFDNQCRYDENTNTVYSLIKNPWELELKQERIKNYPH